MSGEPITKCPVCRYDLTGLPKNHTCPECGFEYDESMRIWYMRQPPWWFTPLTLTLVLVVPLAVLPAISFEKTDSFRVPTHVLSRIFPWYLLIALPVVVLMFMALDQWRRKPLFVMLDDNQLYVKLTFKKLESHRWKEISLKGFLADRLANQGGNKRRSWIEFLRKCGVVGSWFEFRVVVQKHGRLCRITLPIVWAGSTARREFFNSIHERWLRSQKPH